MCNTGRHEKMEMVTVGDGDYGNGAANGDDHGGGDGTYTHKLCVGHGEMDE